MSDILDRLRAEIANGEDFQVLMIKTADEIRGLKEEVEQLRGVIRRKDEALDLANRCENALLADYRSLSDRWEKAIEELPLLAKGGRLMDELEFLRKVVRRMAAVQEGERLPWPGMPPNP